MKWFGRRENQLFAVLAFLTPFVCWLFVMRLGLFGGRVDWISQHSVFPEYFRQQFYDTGELLPEFAANIGGGQNIYHFAYYGLLSPLILPSYLLPFVKMGDYLMAVSVLGLTASVLLLYTWLRNQRFSDGISFGAAVMLLLAGPMIFQSYNQIMFVNYMPFLCMGFLGVDRHFRKKKSGVFTISVFLMIMTSFYFSIGGIFVLVIYGVYRYLAEQERRGSPVCVTGFLKDGVKFIVPIVTAVLMSGVLLAPTAMALLGSRNEKPQIEMKTLLIPHMELLRFSYDVYGIGLTTFAVTVLFAGLFYKNLLTKVKYF